MKLREKEVVLTAVQGDSDSVFITTGANHDGEMRRRVAGTFRESWVIV